jgi:hypothetical protein
MTALATLIGQMLHALDENSISVCDALRIIHAAHPDVRMQFIFVDAQAQAVRTAFANGCPRTEMLLRALMAMTDCPQLDVVVFRPQVDPCSMRYVNVESVLPTEK